MSRLRWFKACALFMCLSLRHVTTLGMALGINRTSSICLLQQDDDHPIRMVDNHLQNCQVHYVLESSKESLKPFEIALSALDEKKTAPFDGGLITNENGNDTLTKATKEIWDGVACLANLQLKPKIPSVSGYVNFDDYFKTDVFANVVSTCCDDDRTARFRLVFPFFPRKFYLMFEQPEMPSDVFAYQFSPILWKAFGLFLILITVVMVAANRLKDKNSDAREATFLTFNMLAQTGADQEPQDGTRRLIFIVGFLFCLVSFNYFSANIISSLQQIKSFESLEEVVNTLEMTLSVPTFPMFLSVLRSSPNPEAVKIVSRLDKNENAVGFGKPEEKFIVDKLTSIQQGNKWDSIIAPDNLLFGTLINDHSPFNRNQLCKFHHFTIPGADTQMGIFAKKDLPLHIIERLRKSMIFMIETGVIGVLQKKYKPRPLDCVDLRKSEFKPISYQYVMLPFYILVAGYFASVVIFGIELFRLY